MAIGQAAKSTATPVEERFLKVRGGNRLHGEVQISGAKNAALKAMSATLLTADEVVLNSVPMITDVFSIGDLLKAFGATVEIDKGIGRVSMQARKVGTSEEAERLFGDTRAAVVATGPLVARSGEVSFARPGGDRIGKRPIDLLLRGLQRMGATVDEGNDRTVIRASVLKGARIYMDYPSHTSTESLLMAATLASGQTTIVNASIEPEVVWLGEMLNRMGARIQGHGTPYITIDGVDRLHGGSETVMPDRLEAGTFAIAAVMTGSDELTLHNVREADMLPLQVKLEEVGAKIWFSDGTMLVRAGNKLRAVDIQTLPFPGFPTDLQAQFVALLTQAEGISLVHERVYESRLGFTDELEKMGASIAVQKLQPQHASDSRSETQAFMAEITGPVKLKGARVKALDIRAGISLVLAGLVADGETVIEEVHHIDRGHENFVGKLLEIGANVVDTGSAVA